MRIRLCVALGVAALACGSTAQALTIVPTFDSSITSRADAAAIESTIQAATQFYKTFSDPVDVNVYFRIGDAQGDLARSVTSLYVAGYADYVDGLGFQASLHPENAILQSAVANLPNGNVAPDVVLTSANLNTLLAPFDLTVPGAVDGPFDGEVVLSDVPGKFVFSGPAGPGQYDAFAAIQHEVDEVLGVGGDYLAYLPPGFVSAYDLDRYNGYLSPSLTTDPNEQAYFSYDGGKTVVRYFNQVSGGDYSDWAKTGCNGAQHVQDVFACDGVPRYGLTRGSPEVLALEAIGYNLAAVPEPGAWALTIIGLAGVGGALRGARRRTSEADRLSA